MIKKLMSAVLIMFFVTVYMEHAFASYVIDGNLTTDWGVTPGKFGLSDWVPNAGVYYKVQDHNPSINFLNPGYGGQTFDAEAMYVDYDNSKLYFAIVTGFPPGGADGWKAGDIAFDFGKDGSYEYGIAATTHNGFTQGSLYSVSSWGKGLKNWGYGDIGYVSAPTDMLTGTLIYDPPETNLVYNNKFYGIKSKGKHYVIEGYMPYSYFGSDWGRDFRVHWTETCGNDAINLDVSRKHVIPEPATLSLFGLGLLGLSGFGFIRRP